MVELSTVEKDIQQAYVKKIKYSDETQDLHTFKGSLISYPTWTLTDS